jgi:hypothetical protein
MCMNIERKRNHEQFDVPEIENILNFDFELKLIDCVHLGVVNIYQSKIEKDVNSKMLYTAR